MKLMKGLIMRALVCFSEGKKKIATNKGSEANEL